MVPALSDIAVSRCPRCENRIEVRRFPPLLHVRRRSEPREGLCCPHCSCRLAWSSGPGRLLRAGQWIFLAGVPLLLSGSLTPWSVVAFGAGGLAMAVGVARQKLQVVEAEFTATIDLDDAEDASAVRTLVTEALSERLSSRAQHEHREAALAGLAGVAYDPGERWLRWDSVDVRCPAPVEEAARCPETGVVIALLGACATAARLRVFDSGGGEAAAFDAPDGFTFHYLTPYPFVQPGVAAVCATDAPVEGWRNWHFRVDLKRGELVRHAPAR